VLFKVLCFKKKNKKKEMGKIRVVLVSSREGHVRMGVSFMPVTVPQPIGREKHTKEEIR